MTISINSEQNSKNLIFRILNNSAAFIGGELFYRFINLFATIIIARSLGKEGYGQFSFIYVYVSFFEAFVQFGLNPILVRQLAQRKGEEGKVLGNAFLFRITLIGIACPFALFLIRVLGYPLSVQQGVTLAYFQLFFTLRTIYEAVFRIHLKMIYPAAWNVIKALINLLLVAIISLYQPLLLSFIAVYLVSGFLGLAGLMCSSRKFVTINFQPDLPMLKYLIKESAPLVISAYMTLIYYRVDVFLLSIMRNFSDVGFYTAATRITESLVILSSALLTSFFPLLSQSFKEDRQAFEKLIRNAFLWLLLLGFPIAIGGMLVGSDLMSLCFGIEYAPAGKTLSILCCQIFFCFLGSLLANILIVCGKQMTDMWISFFLGILNVGMNFLLIPSYSYNGAAVATVLTEMFGMIVYLFFTTRNAAIRMPIPFPELLLSLKINAAYFVILLSIRLFLRLPVILFILLAVAIYAFLLIFFKTISWINLKDYLSHSFKRPKIEPVSLE